MIVPRSLVYEEQVPVTSYEQHTAEPVKKAKQYPNFTCKYTKNKLMMLAGTGTNLSKTFLY